MGVLGKGPFLTLVQFLDTETVYALQLLSRRVYRVIEEAVWKCDVHHNNYHLVIVQSKTTCLEVEYSLVEVTWRVKNNEITCF